MGMPRCPPLLFAVVLLLAGIPAAAQSTGAIVPMPGLDLAGNWAPLIHEDFKGLAAYIDRHNKYSTWEARIRHQFLTTGH